MERYEKQTSPYYAAARLWVDDIIDPADTRKIISESLTAANNNSVLPAQTGPLFDAAGAAGVGIIVTTVDAPTNEQPGITGVTVYVPPADKLTFVITGFCKPDENPFGPVQLYEVAALINEQVRFSVCPSHTGVLLPTTGVWGALTMTVILDEPLLQPLSVAITE